MSKLTLHDWYIRFSLELEKFSDAKEKVDNDLIVNEIRGPEILKIEDDNIDENLRSKLIERMNLEGSERYKSILINISDDWTKDEEPEE